MTRAVLLVGGRGTRLHPYTATFPKPLLPLDEVPILEVLLRQLIRCGVRQITLALGHNAGLIQAYLAHRPTLVEQLELDYVWETQPLGTSGALTIVEGLDATFLVMNGDVLTDMDFTALLDHHREQGAALTIATHRNEVKIDLGVVRRDGDRVVGYVEKPTERFDVSMGVYVYEPAVLRHITPGEYLDFPDLVLALLAAGEPVSSYLYDGLWLDIGRPDDYARAQEMFRDRREELLRD